METLGHQSQGTAPLMKPPEPFETIAALLEMPDSRLLQQPLVNVIGFVKDFRAPMKTKGGDYKCTIGIVDPSRQSLNRGFQVSIFSSMELMPTITGPGDLVLIRKAKIQTWSGQISLLSNRYSEFHIIPVEKIPKKSLSANPHLWQSTPTKSKKPNQAEADYAIWANNHMGESALPTKEEFQNEREKSMNVKDKFSLLKDVKSDQFCNVIGQVVKIFQDCNYLTIYLSDYTANPGFYNYVWPGHGNRDDCEGDNYGHLKHKPNSTKEWPGPFGKMVIQITIFDYHAQFITDHVKTDDFVLLKNLQVKYSKTGSCLEGYLRGDREREGQVQVEILGKHDDPPGMCSRHKEAIRRKREWWTKFERQKQSFFTAEVESREKRKRSENETSQTKSSSKKRRQERRAAAEKAACDAEKRSAQKLNLNEHVRCMHPEKPALSLSDIKSSTCSKSANGHDYTLPFFNANYKANIRVLDFFPAKLEDFAVARRISEYDILSDYSGGEETDIEGNIQSFHGGKELTEKKWEWAFALQVEDATNKLLGAGLASQDRLWLTVDNKAAQMLFGIEEDAMDLRQNPDVLLKLREKMCILWGDLEEQKLSKFKQEQRLELFDVETLASSLDPMKPSTSMRKVGDQPDLDSDTEDQYQEGRLQSKRAALKAHSLDTGNGNHCNRTAANATITVNNKAFTCCIKQYGIRVPESDIMKADAGTGLRWERKYGMFGAVIG